MRILFLTHAFNSISQRLFVELEGRGHQVSVEFDINDAVSIEAVDLFRPDLILAPFLKRAIPAAIWQNHRCLVVHPGIRGDRGPSALDWALLDGEQTWGVTLLEANGEMDAGDVWASVEFPMRQTTKASLYRHEVTEAAVQAVLGTLERLQQGDVQPEPLDYGNPEVRGGARPLVRQADRAIDWQRDPTDQVLRRIRSADGVPGLRDVLCDRELYLYDAHPEGRLRGVPGELIARCGPAVCRATVDGAVWIGRLCDRAGAHPFKLPAIRVLAQEIAHLPEVVPGADSGYRDIWYEEQDGVGFLFFPFYNGAMGSQQCARLQRAYLEARGQDTRAIVLMGGPDFWSNGMDLNQIEAAESPADESWLNINAMNDLALAIADTYGQLTIAALEGNAGAGGVFLARAADEVWTREGVVLNPHYKDMGNLHGSEYWTYLLPRYAGEANARRIAEARLPMGGVEARELGLVNELLPNDPGEFRREVKRRAKAMVRVPAFAARLSFKNRRRAADEEVMPLGRYREQELEAMRLNFYGFDPSYHVARYNFVYKVPKSRTPLTIARHRRKPAVRRMVS